MPQPYQHAEGFFLLAAVTPYISASQGTDPRVTAVVRETPRLDDRRARQEHRWAPKGLVTRLMRAVPNVEEANTLAGRLAWATIRQDPFILPTLAMAMYVDYWDLRAMRADLVRGLGMDRPLPPRLLTWLRQDFHLDAKQLPGLLTVTKRYHLAGRVWYALLLTTPLVALLAVLRCRRETKAFALLLLLTSVFIMTVVCGLALVPAVRYLHPLGFMFLIAAGILIGRARPISDP